MDAGQGGPGKVACEHCGAPLDASHRYSPCPECGRHHRAGYEVCPYRAEENVPVALPGGADYVVVPKKRSARRGDEYYWQLYMDYGDKPATGEAAVDEPPHPALAHESNGNGHVPAEENGMAKPYAGNGSNGNGNGNGHGASHNGLDLAIMDSAPMTLFSEDGSGESATTDTAPVKVSAGNYNDFDYELINDPSRLAAVAEMLARETVVGIDTETTGLDPHTSELLLLQISTADKVYIVDCKRLVPLALKPLLENSHVLKIAQNAKFEYEMLRQQAGITLSGLFDTMLAERLVMAGIGREISLKAIAQKYIGAVLDKSVRESFYKTAAIGDAYLAPEQLHYAARDAFIMMPIWRDQVRELKKHGLEQVADLEFRCIAAVGDMELAGVKIDETRWRKIIEDVAVQRDRSASELADMLQSASMQATMFGVSAINLNSNTQLLDVFGKLGVDLPDTMEATLVKYDHPAIKKLLEYRGFEKTLSAFGENVLSLINPKTGRIHPDFNQYGADTGRFSCTKPNVQQIPATSDFRKCFVAAPGYKLVTCDYSQCLGKDSWVSTESGWVRIQDHPDAVCKGIAETVILTTQRKYQLECTPDHRVFTARGWVEASALREGDWIALSGDAGWQPETLDEHVWLEGFWVGDGGYNKADTIAYFSQGGGSSREELRRHIVATLGVAPKEFGDSFGVKGQREFVTRTRIFNKKDLRLPLDKITHLPSFLSGLFDADGTVDRNGVSFSTRFIGLARDVQMALLRFGVMSTIVSSIAGRNFIPEGRIQYQIRISDMVSLRNFAKHIGFRLTEKAARLRQTLQTKSTRDQGNYLPVSAQVVRTVGLPYKKYVFNHIHGRPYTRVKLLDVSSVEIDDFKRYHWDRVESVSPSGHQVEVFDLMDQPEQRFEASGFVVHNCELRVLAELSGDEGFVGAFISGQDLHTLTASQMFGVPLEEVQKPQRSAAKAINFGLAYGMGPGGLAPRLGVTLDEAKDLISKYFKAYPGVQKWLDKAAKDSVRLGYSSTTIGRKRFYNIPDESLKRFSEDDWRKQIAAIERQGKNSPIQGANADMTKLALIYLRSALKDWDARTVNTVHDEIVVEVREDQAEEVKHIVEREMVRAGQAILKVVPIVAEASLADYWSK